MRLLKFLSEQEDGYTLENVGNDCQPFLKMLGVNSFNNLKNGLFPKVYRGMDKIFDGIRCLGVENRKPVGTEQVYFDVFNNGLKSNGFVPRNHCVFGTGNEDLAGEFGDLYVLFPAGNFKFTGIEADDFNILDPAGKHGGGDGYAFAWLLKDKLNPKAEVFWIGDERKELVLFKVLERLRKMDRVEKLNTLIYVKPFSGITFHIDSATVLDGNKRAAKVKNAFHNTDLLKGIKDKREIWFDCQKYYIVPPECFTVTH